VKTLESDKTILETKIDSVIVYQSGVQITQVGAINLDTGEQILTITELPQSLDKESVRVKGVGNGKIVNISVEFNSKKEFKTEEHKKLQEERERLEKEIRIKERDLNRIREQIEKYKSTEDEFYGNWSKAYAFGEVEMDNFLEFSDKINKKILYKVQVIENFEENLKDLHEELQVIRNKISKLGPIEEIHNFYDITINLNVATKGEFIIEIRYTMRGAWWIPFYDVALTEADARLTMMANVYNRTDLNWENIEVEISTASLNPIMLVRPNPMVLQEYIPYKAKPARKMKKKLGTKLMSKAGKMDASKDMDFNDFGGDYEEDEDEAYYDEPALAPEPEPDIEATYAEVSENIGVQSFKIPNRIDIPSDENPHPVNLTIQELETEKKFFWSSVAPENVIIQDTLKNGDLLLLAGNVKIYYLEEFLGETSIPVIAPKEEFKLGTRVSYDLKIDKKLVDRSKGKKAIKGRLKNNYEYKITIKNLNEVEEDLVVYDRIGHSYSENIKVILDEIIPEPSKKELGVLKWKISMKGVGEKVMSYKYIVDYKKDIYITPALP
jgi:uncharacterized protein (TIGR02231 family)